MRERRHVEGLLRVLRRGGGGTLLVDGEPGSGKSRLLGEAVAAASARGLAVIHGGVAELGEPVPCDLLLDALHASPEREGDPLGSRARLLDRLTAAFEERAGEPVLVALDDLQRADPATLTTLRAVHERLRDRPAGWLLSRSTVPRESPATLLFDLLERHGAERMALAPLTPDAVRAMVADALGRAPSGATRALVDGAGGNPLLIAELLAGLRDGEPAAGELLPPRLRAVVRGWLDALGTEARGLVETVAVLGGTVSLEQAASLLGSTPAALLPAIEESAGAGLLHVTAQGLACRHALVADVVAAGVPALVRRTLTGQLGLLKAAEPAAALLLPGPATEAMDAVIAEGRLAEAEQTVRRRLAAEHGSAHGSVYGTAELRSLLADILYLTGRGDEAVREAETVLAVPGLPHHVRDRATLVRLYVVTRLGGGVPARIFAQEVIGAHSRHGPAAVAAALTALAVAEWEEGRLSDALALAAEAERLAGTEEPGWRRHEPRLAAAAMLIDARRADEAQAVLQRAHDAMFAHNDLAWAADLSALRARAEFVAGRPAGAAREAERALDLAGALHTPLSAPAAAALLAAVALRRGELLEASRHIAGPAEGSVEACAWHAMVSVLVREARDGPEGAPDLLAEVPRDGRGASVLRPVPTVSPWLVRLALRAGDRRGAEAVVAGAEALSQANPEFPAQAASAAHARGLLDGDREALARAADQAADPWSRASALEDLAMALDAAGERGRAAGGLDRALTIYQDAGSARDAARVRQRLRGMGVRHRHWHYADRPESGWESLTETEHTVISLVVAGHTNKQVAEQMFISVHTVSFHLRQIYRKLGINSRMELARLAVARDRAGDGAGDSADRPNGGRS